MQLRDPLPDFKSLQLTHLQVETLRPRNAAESKIMQIFETQFLAPLILFVPNECT